MANLRLLIGYHGAKYHGWQAQQFVPSIEEAITDAVQKMSGGERVRVWGASRTDAGVHAHGQVARFEEVVERPLDIWYAALNRWTPRDINIYAVQRMEEPFEPRHDARGKIYTYRIWTGPRRQLHTVGYVWQLRRPLDVDAMQQAAQALIGEHDFSSFRAVNCEASSPIRIVRRINVERESKDMVRVTVEGSAFLKYMIRNIVGSLVWVGKGSRPAEWIGETLDSKNRTKAGETAPSHGLTLESIQYPRHPWVDYVGEIYRPS